MKVTINDTVFELPDTNASLKLSELLQVYKVTPPFAVALNGDFVPRPTYEQTEVRAGDSLDIVSPIFGG